MRATRVIPGRPQASGSAVATTIIDLVASTLAKSPSIDAQAARAELEPAASLLSMLANSGHLDGETLVLVAGTLRMVIDVPAGEAALAAQLDVRIPTGTATATDWTLHLPKPGHLSPAIEAVVQQASHLTAEPAPTDAPTAAAVTVDLRRLGSTG